MKHPSFKELLATSWAAPVEGRSLLRKFSLKLVLKDLNLILVGFEGFESQALF